MNGYVQLLLMPYLVVVLTLLFVSYTQISRFTLYLHFTFHFYLSTCSLLLALYVLSAFPQPKISLYKFLTKYLFPHSHFHFSLFCSLLSNSTLIKLPFIYIFFSTHCNLVLKFLNLISLCIDICRRLTKVTSQIYSS